MKRAAIQVCLGMLLLTTPVDLVRSAVAAAQVQPLKEVGTTTRGGVEVVIDPRIELMGVIQLLADYPVLTSSMSTYRADVEEYFGYHNGHTAVALFDMMWPEGFAFDAVPRAFATMSLPPDLQFGSVPNDVIARAGGRDRLDAFAAAVERFGHDTHFIAFYNAHRGTYRALVNAAARPIADAIAELETYLGISFGPSRVVLSPLLHDGGFATPSAEPRAQAFIGPVGRSEGFPDFGGPRRIAGVIWHEFAHTAVNPLTDAFDEYIDGLEITDVAFRDEMRRRGYGDWEAIVNEGVVRAIEVRLTAHQSGEEAGNRALRRQMDQGFDLVLALANALRAYEERRAAYPTFADFYPELISALREEMGGG